MHISIKNLTDKNVSYVIKQDKVIIVDPLKTSVMMSKEIKWIVVGPLKTSLTMSKDIKLLVVEPLKKSVPVSRQIKLIVIDPQCSFQSKTLLIKTSFTI